jgi:hypothetical protein
VQRAALQMCTPSVDAAGMNHRSHIRAWAAVAVGALTLALGAPAAPAASSGTRLAVEIDGSCNIDPPGLMFDFTFTNDSKRPVPRTITVYRDSREVFGDDDVAPPRESTLTYGPLAEAEWRIVVTSGRRVIGDETFALGCGG